MYNSLQKLFSSAFVRSVAIVGMGGIGAQAIALLFSPILTRMFGPDEMGALSLFVALTALGGQIGTLSYHNAVPLAKSDGEMLALVKLCQRGAQFFSLLSALILVSVFFFFSRRILRFIRKFAGLLGFTYSHLYHCRMQCE